MMSSSKYVSIFILLTAAMTAAPQSTGSHTRASASCPQETTRKPPVGVAYNGDVSIDDYKLHARIPEGLTGWGGVATDAPFHGFTIFLDSSMRSCIVFEIHLRIDDDEAPVRPRAAKTLSLGNAKAWQISIKDGARGPITVSTYFSHKQNGQTDDGKILLISPPEELQKTRSVYDSFLKSVLLDAPHSP